MKLYVVNLSPLLPPVAVSEVSWKEVEDQEVRR